MTMTTNDPTAAARGIAERLIDMMANEVDAFVIATHQSEQKQPHDPEGTRRRISNAREELARSAVNDIDGIDVRTGFIDLRTAMDAEARINNHVAEACIRHRRARELLRAVQRQRAPRRAHPRHGSNRGLRGGA